MHPYRRMALALIRPTGRSGFVGRIRRSRHPAINARTNAIQQNAGIKKPPGEGRLKDKAGKPALNSRD